MGNCANIRKRRIEKGKTLEAVANAIGVSRQTMSRYETGIIEVPPERIPSIAHELDTTAAYILGYVDDPDVRTPVIEAIDNDLSTFINCEDTIAVKNADDSLISAAHGLCILSVDIEHVLETDKALPEKLKKIKHFLYDKSDELLAILKSVSNCEKLNSEKSTSETPDDPDYITDLDYAVAVAKLEMEKRKLAIEEAETYLILEARKICGVTEDIPSQELRTKWTPERLNVVTSFIRDNAKTLRILIDSETSELQRFEPEDKDKP